MSIQRKVTAEGKVGYRVRIKANGREVASRTFDRKSDAVAWEQDQRRRLRAGEWLDPRRGQVPLKLAGLQVGDRVMVPGPGLRLSRAVLAGNGGGELYVDTLQNKRARTVPLVPAVAPIVDRWSAGKSPGEWLFAAPAGGPLRETNWQRSVSWRETKATIGRPELRVHDLRHTAASVWLASGADPKMVQRVLGHATAAMTMDPYGQMIDRNLWDAAQRLGAAQGTA